MLPEPYQSIQLPMCVRYNAVTKTVITASLFMIFLSQTIAGDVSLGCRGRGGGGTGFSNYERKSMLHYIILQDLDRCQSKNITSIDCSAAAGVKAARPKMPCHLLAVTCSCPGVFVMDSDKPELLNVPLPNKADQRESGRKWRPGRWCLQLVPLPNPSPPCVDSVCSSRTTVPLQVSAQAGILQ